MDKIFQHLGYVTIKKNPIEALSRSGLVVCDVRFNPVSRNPTWNKGNLIRELGSKYVHIRELGNEVYKSESISILDMTSGMDTLLRVFEASENGVVIMCACGDFSVCHRRVIVKKLEEIGYQVSPFETQRDSQISLFTI